MEITKDLYHKISVVCTASNIAVIGDNIFVYESFTPSSSGNTSSIDFCQILGINVTDFFTMASISEINHPTQFLSRFTKYMENLPLLNIKFNKNTDYYLFSS